MIDDLCSIQETADRLSISAWMVRDQIRQGRLASVKIGRRRLVLSSSIAEYIATLQATQAQGADRVVRDVSA